MEGGMFVPIDDDDDDDGEDDNGIEHRIALIPKRPPLAKDSKDGFKSTLFCWISCFEPTEWKITRDTGIPCIPLQAARVSSNWLWTMSLLLGLLLLDPVLDAECPAVVATFG
jgi:hypothetical protein